MFAWTPGSTFTFMPLGPWWLPRQMVMKSTVTKPKSLYCSNRINFVSKDKLHHAESSMASSSLRKNGMLTRIIDIHIKNCCLSIVYLIN